MGEIEDGSKETFLSAQGDIAGLGISSTQLVEEGKVSFLFQFSPSKFLVRNCAGNVFSFFPRSLGRIMKCLRFCSPWVPALSPWACPSASSSFRLPLMRADSPHRSTCESVWQLLPTTFLKHRHLRSWSPSVVLGRISPTPHQQNTQWFLCILKFEKLCSGTLATEEDILDLKPWLCCHLSLWPRLSHCSAEIPFPHL